MAGELVLSYYPTGFSTTVQIRSTGPFLFSSSEGGAFKTRKTLWGKFYTVISKFSVYQPDHTEIIHTLQPTSYGASTHVAPASIFHQVSHTCPSPVIWEGVQLWSGEVWAAGDGTSGECSHTHCCSWAVAQL